MKPACIAALAAGLAALGCSPALSATSTANLAVQMTLEASCTFSAAAAVNFGGHSAAGADVDVTSAVTINCAGGTTFNIGLDKGQGSGATYAARKMTSGTNTLTYSLYSDSARTMVWGDSIGTDTVAGTGRGAAMSYPIYGRVPAQGLAAPGNYVDTVKITITY